MSESKHGPLVGEMKRSWRTVKQKAYPYTYRVISYKCENEGCPETWKQTEADYGEYYSFRVCATCAFKRWIREVKGYIN